MARTKYTPERGWTRDVARMVHADVMDAAGTVQAFAEADDPTGRYTTRTATVHAGWQNEARPGAIVEEVERSWRGAAQRTLARAAEGSDPNRRVRYTTRAGRERWATQAQVDNWTRGRR